MTFMRALNGCFSISGKFTGVRNISGTAAFPSDLNHVTLLGSIASNCVSVDTSDRDRGMATFNLLTRARYRAADRFMLKLVYHRIHVFDEPLINKIRDLTQGDRVCVIGVFTSFKKSSNDWMQCITAQNIIVHSSVPEESSLDDHI